MVSNIISRIQDLTFDPKMKKGHLLVMTNLQVYEDFVINSFQDKQQKPFKHSRSPWPSDPKIKRGHLIVMTNLQYEDFVIYGYQDNQRKPSGLPTDRLSFAKQYTASS